MITPDQWTVNYRADKMGRFCLSKLILSKLFAGALMTQPAAVMRILMLILSIKALYSRDRDENRDKDRVWDP